MKEKRLAVIIGRCLTVCVLALHLNVMTASAEPADEAEYQNVLENTMEAEITLEITGYIELSSASASPGTKDPDETDPGSTVPGDDNVVTTVTKVQGNVRAAAPKTSDEARPELFMLQFMIAGMMICLMVWQMKEAGEKHRVPENAWYDPNPVHN